MPVAIAHTDGGYNWLVRMDDGSDVPVLKTSVANGTTVPLWSDLAKAAGSTVAVVAVEHGSDINAVDLTIVQTSAQAPTTYTTDTTVSNAGI